MNLLVLLLIALPMCIAQFSIQGPSDGNRVAQGLTIQEGKGVQYTDQSAPVSGGFTIQGAQDGHSNVQGGTDSHSNFNIRGSSDAGAERYIFQGATTGDYNIQGASDGHSQPQYIQGSYDGDPSTKALQYNDPSGSRVNWRSYDRQSLPGAQQQTRYSEAVVPANAPRSRQRAHAQPRPQPQPEPVNPIPTKSVESAPEYIKQLLQFQAQIPYVNIIPEPFRYDALVTSQEEVQGNQQPQYQRVEEDAPAPRRPTHRGKSRGPSRHRRQAQQGRPEAAPQQHRRPSQPPPEPQYRYSTNLPPTLQQLLKFQAQTPYINIIPEQYRFNPEAAIQEQMRQVKNHYEDLLRRQPAEPVVQQATFGRASTRSRPQEPAPEHSREKRQAPHQQQQLQPQQLPAEPRPQYSTNLPSHIQNLLKYQAQIPYNIIANQISYRLEKPYVPQPVQPSAPSQQSQYQAQQAQYQAQQADYQPQQAQYQPQPAQYQEQQAQYQAQQAQYQAQQAEYQPQYQTQQAAYQSQGDQYQGQSSGYNQQYTSQIQYPSGYQQSGNEVRPVTESQY